MRKASSGWRRRNAQNAGLLHQQHLGRFQRAGIGGIALLGGQRDFGKDSPAAKDVDDLLLAGGVDAMDIYRTALDDVETAGGSPSWKSIALGQGLDDRCCGDVLQVRQRQTGEELATAQRVGDAKFFLVHQGAGHAEHDSISFTPEVNHPVGAGAAFTLEANPRPRAVNQRRGQERGDDDIRPSSALS